MTPKRPEPRLLRLRRLLEEVAGARSRAEIARRMGCSVRTVARLLRQAEEAFDVRIVYARPTGYRVIGRARLERGELEAHTAMAAAAGLLDGLKADEIRQSIDHTLEASWSHLDHRTRLGLQRLRERVVARPPAGHRPPEGVLCTLLAAIRDERAVKFVYRGDESAREVWPLSIAWLAGKWYLFGVPYRARRLRREANQYALWRMTDVEAIPGSPEEDGIDPARRLRKRFRRFVPRDPKAPVRQIKIRFTADAARWLENIEFHENQSVRRLKDGSIHVTLPAPSLYEALRFVLSYGPTVEVVEPKELREAVAETARRILRVYERPPLPRNYWLRDWPDGLFEE